MFSESSLYLKGQMNNTSVISFIYPENVYFFWKRSEFEEKYE